MVFEEAGVEIISASNLQVDEEMSFLPDMTVRTEQQPQKRKRGRPKKIKHAIGQKQAREETVAPVISPIFTVDSNMGSTSNDVSFCIGSTDTPFEGESHDSFWLGRRPMGRSSLDELAFAAELMSSIEERASMTTSHDMEESSLVDLGR
jgi:hypothetical protein